MKKDGFNFLVLLLLVCTSLFLSYMTWSQISYGPVKKSFELIENRPVNIEEFLKPGKIIVNFGQNVHTVLNPASPFLDEAWGYLKGLLEKSSPLNPAVSTSNYDAMTQKRGMEFVFDVPLPYSSVKSLLNIKSDSASIKEEQRISSVVISEEDGLSVFLKGESGEFFKIANTKDYAEFIALLKKMKDSRAPLYTLLPKTNLYIKVAKDIYISLENQELPVYRVKDVKNSYQNIAPKFFPDFTIARRIEEKDGAVIFTDGTRGLRIFPRGIIEYTRPLFKEQKSKINFQEALTTAVNFIATHGGFPKSAYLHSFKINNQAITFVLRERLNGLPLIKAKDYIVVTVEDNQVTYYYRWFTEGEKIEERLTPISPIKAIDTVVSLGKIKEIDDLYLGYAEKDNSYIPIWVLKSDKGEFYVDAAEAAEITLKPVGDDF